MWFDINEILFQGASIALLLSAQLMKVCESDYVFVNRPMPFGFSMNGSQNLQTSERP